MDEPTIHFDRRGEASRLAAQVREAFGPIPFPSHCGLHAALAMDDWIEDPAELRRITEAQDFKGEWWEVPDSELDRHLSLASCYLDAEGTRFYLPALLIAVLRDCRRARYQGLVFWFHPLWTNEPDPALQAHCLSKFALLSGAQRLATRSVIVYGLHGLEDPWDFWTSGVRRLLEHDYWLGA